MTVRFNARHDVTGARVQLTVELDGACGRVLLDGDAGADARELKRAALWLAQERGATGAQLSNGWDVTRVRGA